MKNVELFGLQELSLHETISTDGGGFFYDLFHNAGQLVGSGVRSVVDYLSTPRPNDPSNAATLSSGTYYGR